MSRQGSEPESQSVLKRPRQEDKLVQHSSSTSIPRSIIPSVHGFDIFPAIRGVQDQMSNWMSSLIQSIRRVPSDGCSQGFYGQSPTRAIGTACSTALSDAIYDRSSLISTCTTSTSRCPTRASPRRVRQSLRPRRRSSSTHASTQQ